MKKKGSIVIAILLLAVGFAAISTTLIINGSTKVSENADDFSVIFTKATLDGQDVYANVIDDTKKIITFETSDLKTLNQTSVLNYEVTNNSANYDAEVQVNCKVKDDTTAKYTSIKNELEGNATVVKAKETLNGTLTITLNKTATEEVKEQYVCELTFNAVERDELGATFTAWVPTYFDFGIPTAASTRNYETLGKTVFAGLSTDGSQGICIFDNELVCYKVNDYKNSVIVLKNHFGESNCGTSETGFWCSNGTLSCSVKPDGEVRGGIIKTNEGCYSYSDGTVGCS